MMPVSRGYVYVPGQETPGAPYPYPNLYGFRTVKKRYRVFNPVTPTETRTPGTGKAGGARW